MYISLTYGTKDLAALMKLTRDPRLATDDLGLTVLDYWTEDDDAWLLSSTDSWRRKLRCYLAVNHIDVREYAKAAKVSFQTAVNFLAGATENCWLRTFVHLVKTMLGRISLIQEDRKRARRS